MSSIERQYQRGIRWNFIGSLGAAVLQMAQTVLFARLASPEAAGDYALAATGMAFLGPLAESGVNQAIVQSKKLEPGVLTALMMVNIGLGLLLILLTAAGGPALAAWYQRPELGGLLLLMSVILLFTPFGAQSAGLLVRHLQFEKTAKIEVSAWLISCIAAGVLGYWGWGAWAMAWAFVLRNLAAVLATYWVAAAQFASDYSRVNWQAARPLLRFGWYDLAGRWTEFTANYVDKLIIGKWLGAAALGFYNLAFTLSMMPTARVGYVFTRVSFPVFARMQESPEKVQAFFEYSGRQVILALLPLYAAMYLFSNEVIWVLFGPEWQASAFCLRWLAVAGVVRSMSALFPQLLKGLGRPRLLLVWLLGWSLGAALVLLVFLWIKSDIEMAVWARVAAKFSIGIALLVWVARRIRLSFIPLAQESAALALSLAAVVGLALVTGQCVDGFEAVLCVKTCVFTLGLGWLYFWGPFKNKVKAAFRTRLEFH